MAFFMVLITKKPWSCSKEKAVVEAFVNTHSFNYCLTVQVKLEEEHGHLISDVVHAGSNIMLLCAQVASKIDLEQKRPIWIPSGTIW